MLARDSRTSLANRAIMGYARALPHPADLLQIIK